MKIIKTFLLGVTTFGLALIVPVRAVDLIWTNGSGDFNSGANWSSGTAPAGGDSTSFTNDTDYTVNFSAAPSILNSNSFYGKAGTVTLDITGFTWTLTNAFSVGRNGNATATVYLVGGKLAVTNAANTATITVGDAGFSQGALLVTNGTVIAGNTLVGRTFGARGTLLISGPSTVWTNVGAGTLTVGQGGSAFNTITISNGARFFAGATAIGNSGGASNNVYNVGGLGASSIVSNGTLSIGNGAGLQGNSMVVTNATLLSNTGTVGNGASLNSATILADATWNMGNFGFSVGAGTAGSNNSVVIDGGVVTNVSTLRIGISRAFGNSVTVSNGAKLFTVRVIIADGNNTLTTSNCFYAGGLGLPSTLSLGANGLLIGNSGGSSNLMVITNATVLAPSNPTVGFAGSNNTCTVLAGGTLDFGPSALIVGQNTAAGNVFNLDQGAVARLTSVTIGRGAVNSNAVNNTVNISNGAVFNSSGAVTLGAVAGDNGNAYNVGGNGASCLVSNAAITVGVAGTQLNTMTVTNAALVSNAGTIGSGGSNNTASILAGGSWNLQANGLVVGSAGAGNALIINGGVVTNTGVIRIGFQNGGSGNSLTLQNGAQLLGGASTVHVGDGSGSAGASNNAYNVGGFGLPSFASNLTVNVGRGGSGSCRLTITNATLVCNGGPVVGGDGAFGAGSGTSNNAANVWADGTWDIGGSALTVGLSPGVGNTLAVGSGGTVSNMSALSVSTGNALHMQGGLVRVKSPTAFVSIGGTLSGVGTIDGNTTLGAGSSFSPGDPVGTLSFTTNLVLDGTTTLQYNLGTNSSLAAVGGDLTLAGTLHVSDAGGFTNATYTLFTYSGTLTDNGLVIGSVPNPVYVYSIVAGGGVVQLNVTCTNCAAGDPFAAWQNQFFGSTNCSLCGGDADFDGDGLSNTNEFLAGFDPTNSASVLRIISAVAQGDDLVITWSTVGGKTNVLQATAGDSGSFSNDFTDLSGAIVVSGSGDVTTNFTDVGGATNAPARYYRVRLVP